MAAVRNDKMRFVIGARGSALSLAQTQVVREHLMALMSGLELSQLATAPDAAEWLPIRKITTSGDRILDRRLAPLGGKGLFTKEIDEALLSGEIDIAVHSLKDLPSALPTGLVLAAVPKREAAHDALISLSTARFMDLPKGARLGTASVRRRAQALRLRPDLQVETLRGNIDSRIARIEAGQFDATFLALAGLRRLGRTEMAREILSDADFLPAPCQGALALVCRADDERVLDLLARIEDPVSRLQIEAERAFLAKLDGSCQTPIAALARWQNGVLRLEGEILSLDGQTSARDSLEVGLSGWDPHSALSAADRELAAKAGVMLAEQLIAVMPR